MPDIGEAPGSLVRVLATEGKTPLKDATTSSPQRAKKTNDRSKVSRNRIIAGVVAGVVVLGVIFFLTRGGNSILPIGSNPPPGKVAFKLNGVHVIRAELHSNQAAQKATAHTVADQIKTQLDSLFDKAYVDPDSWSDTGKIEEFFTDAAKASLEGNATTLTNGPNASDTYKSVDPKKSTIKVEVLADAKGNAIRASAAISFTGLATHTDGTTSNINVTGTAIFVQDGGTWKIESYNLKRSETRPKTATTSPTSEGS